MSFPLLGTRPRLVPTILVGLAFLILLGLGTWQVERLAWKTNLLNTITTRMKAPPRSLAGPDVGRIDDYERVRVTGHFVHDREIHLLARSLQGELGYHIVTPFAVDGDGTVLINRGFVPQDRRDPATRGEGQVQGTVDVTGLVRYPHKPGLAFALPDNRPAENVWIWLDLPQISQTVGMPALAPFVIDADATPNPGGLPIGGQTRLEVPNDHLQYALTWYGLAVALVIMFIVYHRRPPRSATVERKH
ncbi:MAG: SURF1 family protein [Gemmatimonas sp.]